MPTLHQMHGWMRASMLGICCSALLAVELKPNETASLPIADLPRTLADQEAQLIVRLPAGYDATRDWPVFLWLNGGTGAPGINAQLAGDIPFVCVSMPLFKRRGAPPGEAALQDADGEALAPAFRKMLAELDRLVPNQDRHHSILGGFSNGANAIKVLSIKAPEVLQRFGGILLNDGGVFIATEGGALIPGPGADPIFDVKQLRGRRLLGVGAEKMAGRGLKELCALAEQAGAQTTFVMMVGKGHSQVSEGDELKQTLQWIADMVRAGITDAQAAMKAGVAAKKWPAAVAAYRDLVRFHDPQVAGTPQVAADLVALQTACAQAVDKQHAAAASKDAHAVAKDLRIFIATWQPLVPDAIREQAGTLASAELEKAMALSSIPTRRERLQKMLADWHGYPIEESVNAELAKIAPAPGTGGPGKPAPPKR